MAPVPASALIGVCSTLSVAYGLFMVYSMYFSAVLLSSGRTLTRQTIVHIIISLLCIARCAFFAAVPRWDGVYFYVRMSSSDVYQTGLYVLEETPTLLLVTLHCQQLLTWADSYLTSLGQHELYPRVAFRTYSANAFLYAAQIVIWVAYDRTQLELDSDYWSLIASVLHLVAVLSVGVALVVYGYRMRHTVQGVPASLTMRLKQMRNVEVVVGVCTVAFTVRCVALVAASWATFTDAGGFSDSATAADTAMTALFFVATELLPISMVLWYNSTRPGRRNSRKKAVASPATPRTLSKRLSVTAALRSMRFQFSPIAGGQGSASGKSDGVDNSGAKRNDSLAYGFSMQPMFRAKGSGGATERTPLVAAPAGSMVTPMRRTSDGEVGEEEGSPCDVDNSPVTAMTLSPLCSEEGVQVRPEGPEEAYR